MKTLTENKKNIVSVFFTSHKLFFIFPNYSKYIISHIELRIKNSELQ